MTEAEARELAEITQQDQDAEPFRRAARHVAVYLAELRTQGVKKRESLELAAEMQHTYLDVMLGGEL